MLTPSSGRYPPVEEEPKAAQRPPGLPTASLPIGDMLPPLPRTLSSLGGTHMWGLLADSTRGRSLARQPQQVLLPAAVASASRPSGPAGPPARSAAGVSAAVQSRDLGQAQEQ